MLYCRKEASVPSKKDMQQWKNISNEPPPGLRDPADQSVTISFHALVPLHLWGWDKTSKMHIHFDHKDLGHWNSNCGEFKEIGFVVNLLQ